MSIAVIVNGSKPERLRRRLETILRERLQQDYNWYVTEKPGDATRLASEVAGGGIEAVVAAGGDGTVQEVVRGIAGTSTALGVIPLGAANDFARCMGIPLSMSSAIEGLNRARGTSIDLLKANDQWVVTGMGCGIHAEVGLHCKRYLPYVQRLGAWGPRSIYLLEALERLLLKPLPKLQVTLVCDGERITKNVALIAINNQAKVGGLFIFTPEARLDDGNFHLCILESCISFFKYPELIYRVLRGTLRNEMGVTLLRGRRFELISETPIACMGDGEWLGTSQHWTVEIVPKILKVWVPND